MHAGNAGLHPSVFSAVLGLDPEASSQASPVLWASPSLGSKPRKRTFALLLTQRWVGWQTVFPVSVALPSEGLKKEHRTVLVLCAIAVFHFLDSSAARVRGSRNDSQIPRDSGGLLPSPRAWPCTKGRRKSHCAGAHGGKEREMTLDSPVHARLHMLSCIHSPAHCPAHAHLYTLAHLQGCTWAAGCRQQGCYARQGAVCQGC